MATLIAQADAFIVPGATGFTGNPAAVCLLDGPRDESWMQGFAAEMNLSETAFLSERDDGYDLRWFTPTVEVDLCGHATLAAAHVLWERGLLRSDVAARFHTRSGLLVATRDRESIEMDFPGVLAEPAGAPPGLHSALSDVVPAHIAKNRFDYLVELESEDAVRKLAPDLRTLANVDARGVIVTAPSASQDFDFVSRFFAPASGIDEDPVTGSAHCCLGLWWQARLGRDEFVAFQASKRGGVVHVRVNGDRVVLGGLAKTVFCAELSV